MVENEPKEGWSFDPVTEADRQAEIATRNAIQARYPDHAILGEEFGVSGTGPYRWTLDPVDGTRPFICGLTVDGRAEAGMMSQPFTGERFWAAGESAWEERAGRRRRLATRDVGNLSQAILHTTSPNMAGTTRQASTGAQRTDAFEQARQRRSHPARYRAAPAAARANAGFLSMKNNSK